MNSLLTTREVSEILRVHENTVHSWRRNGDGPPVLQEALVMLSPRVPRYKKSMIMEWIGE